ncbi:uncharacterized protein LOC124683755 [Lolium rigidum]|uniref:uncharacterized protein LOC124683755 n=1 Tax=Lolium rigidum TaxID=89674 RepID=UPI001F5DEA13|nr:uncharacterized protein LOC124683755 [Lolium rigidum]
MDFPLDPVSSLPIYAACPAEVAVLSLHGDDSASSYAGPAAAGASVIGDLADGASVGDVGSAMALIPRSQPVSTIPSLLGGRRGFVSAAHLPIEHIALISRVRWRNQLGVSQRSWDEVIDPCLGTTFDSINEAYDFYNLHSCEHGFGIRYGKSRLNSEKTKCMQEIVCGCSRKPTGENTRSCRCECPAMIRLLRSADNGWYITEHRVTHNHVLTETCGEFVEVVGTK